MKLESNRSPLTVISLAILISFVLVAFFASEMRLALAITFSLVFALMPTMLYWVVYANKPAAWIENDVLYFRTWPLSITKIARAEVEYVRYLTGYEIPGGRSGPRICDLLRVKLKGYSDWDIPITDDVDHLKDKRLYRFINQPQDQEWVQLRNCGPSRRHLV